MKFLTAAIILLSAIMWTNCGGSSSSSSTVAEASNRPQVTITWTDTTPGPLVYALYRSTVPGGPYALVADNLTGSSYTDYNVKRNSVWYYIMTARNSSGTSGYSNELRTNP